MKKLIRISAILVMMVWFVLMASPVLAADPPDSISIDVKYVNRNLIQPGDMLFYAIYDIDYTLLPDEDIDEIFIFRLVDTDGTTELGSNEAYPFDNQGYGKGVISFYFTAADAAALAWGSGYFIRVQGKPGFFAAPPDQLFVLDASDWTAQVTQDDNREEARNNVISMARVLESDWPVGDLLIEIDIGTVFSLSGEEYFRNSIFGIQAMVPSLFESQIADADYTERTWNTTQQTTYEERWVNTTIGAGITGLSDVWSLDFNMVASLPILIASILCIVAAARMNGKPEAGFLCVAALVILGGFMGWTPFALIAVASTFCLLYIAMVLIQRIPT